MMIRGNLYMIAGNNIYLKKVNEDLWTATLDDEIIFEAPTRRELENKIYARYEKEEFGFLND